MTDYHCSWCGEPLDEDDIYQPDHCRHVLGVCENDGIVYVTTPGGDEQ